MSLFRTKSFALIPKDTSRLKPCLNLLDLTLLGIGAIIGAGVFVLTGIAAATKSGPAISLSYVVAGLASLFAALSYAELSASIGGCGSAYNYSYAGFGEIVAWMIGWDLLLEYTVGVSSVAIGWSGYFSDALKASNIPLPNSFLKTPFEGGLINLPAVLIIFIVAILLCDGVKQSARINMAIVMIKLLVIALFIFTASSHIHADYWHPFLPYGWNGMMQGAALVFFAYIGFDAISTAAEECINPARDLPRGIIISVSVCTIIYIIVAALLCGIVPYQSLNISSPVAHALFHIGHPIAAGLIALGAIAGLTSMMVVTFYGVTRICLSISRDGLLPPLFAKVHPRTRTPVFIILLIGFVMSCIAGFVPLKEAAELVNIGTLAAFTLVCSGVIFMRVKQPHMPRPFKLPLFPFIPLMGIAFCLYLMLHLNMVTWLRFLSWLGIGLVIYFVYGKQNSVLQKGDDHV